MNKNSPRIAENLGWIFLGVALGCIFVMWFYLNRLKNENAALQNELRRLKEQSQFETSSLPSQNSGAHFQEARQPAPTPMPIPTPPLANDPEVQERIQNYQKAFAQRKYAQLVTDIGGLSPDEFDKFLATLRSGSLETTEGELKQLLGDERYQKYQEYIQKIPERRILNELRNQLAYSTSPFSVEQDQKLLQVFAEERKNVEPILGKNPNRMIAYDEFEKIPEEQLIQKLQAKQQFYQKIVDRASSFLSHEQSEALSNYLQEKMDIEDMNLLTAKKLKELHDQGKGFD